ncbi:hypothetical protein [Kutzneria sp. NPDC051319]|uniref:hypothetical protein n=1 Tax=Kutzneria sp. NPDC051319 TaxID=3155047 RepID=UPI00341E1F37
MASKRHDQIDIGDVIKGETGGWWRVTNITKQSDGFRQFDAVSVKTGRAGYLSGPARQVREVR